ncbi:MAG: class II aldolase/adducin family protein [Candidatus Omnitrophota bacterium]
MGMMEDLIENGKFLHRHGLVIGAGGNISVRDKGFFTIKRSGVDMSCAGPSDYTRVSFSSEDDPEQLGVSSEVFIHRACYMAREDVLAVAHAHPPYSVAASGKLSLLESPSYEFDCLVGRASPVIPYIQPGSPELGKTVADKIRQGSNAVILKRHGVVAVGKDIKEACLRVLAIERACMTLCRI